MANYLLFISIFSSLLPLLVFSLPLQNNSNSNNGFDYNSAGDYHDHQQDNGNNNETSTRTTTAPFHHAFATLTADCSNYATLNGGTNISFLILGEVLPNNVTATLEIVDDTKIISNNTKCWQPSRNLIQCQAPTLARNNGLLGGNVSTIFSCNDDAKNSSSSSSCLRLYLDGEEIRPDPNFPTAVKINYYKDPVFISVTFATTRRLWLSGEGLTLWRDVCTAKLMPKNLFNITRDGQACLVDWEQSDMSNLVCWVDKEAKNSNVIVEFAGSVIFRYPPTVSPPVTPQSQKSHGQSWLLLHFNSYFYYFAILTLLLLHY